MSSMFRNKTIKVERHEASKKKVRNHDIIKVKHNEIMSNIKTNKSNLIKMKAELEKMNAELEQLTNDELCDNYIEMLEQELISKKKDLPIEQKTKVKSKKVIQIGYEKDTLKLKQIEYVEELEKKLKSIKTVFGRNCYISMIKNKKKLLVTEIYDLENNVDELDYFEKNIDILTEYCSNNQQPTTVKEIGILELFDNETLFKESNVEKDELLDRYLQATNSGRRLRKVNIGRICKHCNIPKLLNCQDSTFTCANCCEVEYVVMDSDKPSYNSNIETKTNSYKRINHCSEILNQSQGKESTEIEQELMDKIIEELKILGITDLTTVNKQCVKRVLKSIGESAKSEHAVFIANKLNGIAVQTIPHELVEIVKAMWTMIEEAWHIYKDADRRNFMNSSFVFHKIFELLDEQEEAEKWPYLADDKLKKYDKLWLKICNHWGWTFYPSIQ